MSRFIQCPFKLKDAPARVGQGVRAVGRRLPAIVTLIAFLVSSLSLPTGGIGECGGVTSAPATTPADESEAPVKSCCATKVKPAAKLCCSTRMPGCRCSDAKRASGTCCCAVRHRQAASATTSSKERQSTTTEVSVTKVDSSAKDAVPRVSSSCSCGGEPKSQSLSGSDVKFPPGAVNVISCGEQWQSVVCPRSSEGRSASEPTTPPPELLTA